MLGILQHNGGQDIFKAKSAETGIVGDAISAH